MDSLQAEPPGKPKNTGVGSLSLLQWIVLTQESNLGLLHCRRILYQLSSTIIHKVRHLCYPCPCLLYAADVTIFPYAASRLPGAGVGARWGPRAARGVRGKGCWVRGAPGCKIVAALQERVQEDEKTEEV